jgi:hypothetical protein
MVCAKCQKLSKSTALATPAVKKKSEMYYGSPAVSSKSGDKTKTSATLGNNGIGKVEFTIYGVVSIANSFQRVNYYQKQLEIPTLHTRVLAQPAKRRSTRAGHIVKSAHTKQMVRKPSRESKSQD